MRHAIENGDTTINPCTGLRLPAVRGRRERFAEPSEAAALIAAVPRRDRAVWATAFYAGLRRGELRALRWSDINEAVTEIAVARGWDDVEGEIDPKTRKGIRRVSGR